MEGNRLCLFWGRVQLKRDGTRWRTGGEVKGKLPNGVGRQYPSHHLWNRVYPALLPLLPLMRTPRLPFDWTDTPADLNGLVCFAERQNLVSTRVPSHFKSSLLSKHLLEGTSENLQKPVRMARCPRRDSNRVSPKIVSNLCRLSQRDRFDAV